MEAAGNARLMGSRGEADTSGRVVEVVQHSFSFSLPKRERKLSDEEQEEAKWPKSPEREDEQQAEQPGSGGEGGEEEEREMPSFKFGMTEEIQKGMDCARRQ